MSQISVKFKNIKKTYDGKHIVVDDMSLDILKGEFVTLLGPSGSGKTTCLMMLAGFEEPTEGHIFINDELIDKKPSNERNLGMVFQDYALFPHMTVEQNLAFPLQVRKIPSSQIDKKVAAALSKVQLSGYNKRRISQLSGGQKQRVAVARCLVFEPEIILMDEPLGALDKNLREQLQYELKHLHEALGITFIYVTHDQTEALTMSNRIAVFNEGIVQQYAAPMALYESPSNSFVANFIGENNILNGQITEIKSTDLCQVQLDDGTLLSALAVCVSEVGQKTSLSLRPERVCLVTGDNHQRYDNVVNAKVLEIIYLGDHLRLRLAVAQSESFIVKIPNSAQQQPLKEGNVLKIGWQTRDCRALDEFTVD